MMKDKTNNCIMEPRHNNQNLFQAVEKTLKKKEGQDYQQQRPRRSRKKIIMTMLLFDSN